MGEGRPGNRKCIVCHTSGCFCTCSKRVAQWPRNEWLNGNGTCDMTNNKRRSPRSREASSYSRQKIHECAFASSTITAQRLRNMEEEADAANCVEL